MITFRAVRKALSKRLVFTRVRPHVRPLFHSVAVRPSSMRRSSKDSAKDLPKDLSWISRLVPAYFFTEFRNSVLSKPPGFCTSNFYEFWHPPEFFNFGYLPSFSGLSSFCRTLRTMSSSGIPSHDLLPSEIASMHLRHYRNCREILLERFRA
jgi:hypothetical protein